ncbi:hypothetical protein DLM_0354 [Aquitalea magnusonii]|uniref:Uncharacterized protein n=1 Tax=Aquitalea magnusonii TaxID=332411 RepID=A0A3G9GEL7_9NEIS|nr:hypothetical protein DLM_0354 [Aquitalea magnusonii]
MEKTQEGLWQGKSVSVLFRSALSASVVKLLTVFCKTR